MKYSDIIRDLCFGITTLGFAVFFGVSTALTIAVENDGTAISSRTFPYIVSGGMGILSLALVLNSVKVLRSIPADSKTYIPAIPAAEFRRVVLFTASLALYILGFIYIGYVISTMVYILFMFYLMRAKNRLAVAVLTLTVPGILWYFFTVVLEVQFPESLLM